MTGWFKPGWLLAGILWTMSVHGQTASLEVVDTDIAGAVEIRLDADMDVQGVIIAAIYDGALMVVDEISVVGTLAENADFIVPSLIDDTGFTLSIIMDFLEPFGDPPPIPSAELPGTLALFHAVPTVPSDPSMTAAVMFVDGVLGDPPLSNTVVIDGMAITAARGLELHDGILTLVQDEDTAFVRGDCNSDGSYDFGDLISGLSCLFMQEEVQCMDACDANDMGGFNLGDPMFIVMDLYGGGAPPPPPNTCDGADSTLDLLPCAADSCP